jgi:hypothetical protein
MKRDHLHHTSKLTIKLTKQIRKMKCCHRTSMQEKTTKEGGRRKTGRNMGGNQVNTTKSIHMRIKMLTEVLKIISLQLATPHCTLKEVMQIAPKDTPSLTETVHLPSLHSSTPSSKEAKSKSSDRTFTMKPSAIW